MSLTEDEVAICNQALSKFGSFTMDYSDQTKNEGVHCNRHYEQTRDALQRSYNWNFTAKRIILVSSWEEDTYYTTDQYAWEDDVLYKCTTAHRSTEFNSHYVYDGDDLLYDTDDLVFDEDYLIVDSDGTFYWQMVLERPEFYWSYKYQLPADFLRLKPKWLKELDIRFKIENGYLLCSEQEINLHYTGKVTDPDDFDPLFTEVLILDLALKLLYPLAGAKTQDLKIELYRERLTAMAKAKAVCENEADRTGYSYWNNARYGSGKV